MRRRAVAVAAVAGAAVIGISAPGAWASSGGKSGGATPGSSGRPTSSAADAPAGNNGHIQIDEYAMDGGNGNDPHVACGFSISFFGYDAGTRTATVSVTPWSPTRGGTPFHSGPLTWDQSHRTSGNQLDFNYPVSPATVADIFSGVTPAKQGYHARIEVEVNGSQGSDDKHKMVWIAPCAPTTTSSAAPSGAAPSGATPSGSAGSSVAAASLVRTGTAGPAAVAPSGTAAPSGATARRVSAGVSPPVAVLGESVSRPVAAAPAGSATPTLGGLPFTGADIALESLISLGLLGSGAFLTRRYRLRRR